MALLPVAITPPLAFAVLLWLVTRRRNWQVAATWLYAGWLLVMTFAVYRIWGYLQDDAVAQGLAHTGMPIVVASLWLWLAVAAPAIGALILLLGVQRRDF